MDQIKQILDIVKTGDIKAAEAAIKQLLSKKKDTIVSEGKEYVAKSLFEDEDCAGNKEDKSEDDKSDDAPVDDKSEDDKKTEEAK